MQSIPVLGFMRGVVLTLVALFPSTNVRLKLGAVLMISGVGPWNMTFSYYSVPRDGWVTATGGAWNASIVSEYMNFKGQALSALALDSQISIAAEKANLLLLAASVTVMSVIVVALNRTVWRTCYRIAEQRFSLIR